MQETVIDFKEMQRRLEDYKKSRQYLNATCSVEEIRQVMAQYDNGLLTPGDVLYKTIVILAEWERKA